MHYYTFKPKDYMSKTAFLEPMEDLAYRRMLDHCYLTELPLPESIDEIAMLIRMRSHTDSIKIVLHYFFELTPQGYVNDRIARELTAYHGKSRKAKASADARWSKERNKIKDIPVDKSQCKIDANALRDEYEGNANQEPITNNHKPVNLKPSSASPPEPYPEEFETAWQAYPPRPGASKKDSYKGWTARRKEGVSTEALLAGVQRYANYVLLSRTEPQFTKQPATFFGPGEHYKADWAVGATQTQKGVIHGKFGKQDYHKGVGADGTF